MGKKFFRQSIAVAKLPPVLKYKWGDAALEEGVTGVPKKLVRCLAAIFPGSTGMEQLQVALTLVDYRREDEPRLPTSAFLAFLAGLPEEIFMARIQELHDRGLIRYEKVRNAISFDVHGLLREIDNHAKTQPPASGLNAVETDMQ